MEYRAVKINFGDEFLLDEDALLELVRSMPESFELTLKKCACTFDCEYFVAEIKSI